MKPTTLVTLLLSLSLLVACGAPPAPATTDDAVGTAVAQTLAAQAPTTVPEPTAAAEPAADAPAAAASGTLPVDGTAVKGAATAQQPALFDVELPGASVVSFDMLVGGTGKVFLFRGDEAIFGYDFFGAGQTISERRVLKADEGGPYTLRLDGDVTYELKVAATPQEDGGVVGDAGATPETAHTVTLNPTAPFEGQLGNNDKADYYKIDVPAGSVLTLETRHTGKGVLISTLYGDDVKLVSTPLGFADGYSWNTSRILNNAEGGTYILAVEGESSYEFRVLAEPQQDGGIVGDAGDSPEQARAITSGSSAYQGQLGNNDTFDFYTITLPPGSVVVFDSQHTAREGWFVSTLYRNGEKIDSTPLGLGIGYKWNTLWRLDDTDGGEYVLGIEGDTTYTFTIMTRPQQDGGTTGDAGDSEATAGDTAVGQTLTGQVGDLDENDTYRLTLTEPTRILLSGRIPEGKEGNVWMGIWRNGADLGGVNFVVGRPARLSGNEPLPAGEYFLVVTGRGDYQIEVGTE